MGNALKKTICMQQHLGGSIDARHGANKKSVLRQFHCDFSLAAGQSSDSKFPA
ncbi:hypothetical protein [Limnohabitans sp. DM1]|uniref:hypothetical protein n=1 Tax=Limnohabitans sp. DM1 TaxID=1597955 RepID=UPI001892C8F4|nr:hypothetical protein [Limnohabitans sp. DM1]